MRSLIFLLAALTGEAVARSHIHAHGHRRRHDKRDTIEEKVTVTVVECWLDGHLIPKAECDAGIANGSLKWADDGSLVAATSVSVHTKIAPSPAPSPVPVPAPVPPPAPAPPKIVPPAPAPPKETPSPAPKILVPVPPVLPAPISKAPTPSPQAPRPVPTPQAPAPVQPQPVPQAPAPQPQEPAPVSPAPEPESRAPAPEPADESKAQRIHPSSGGFISAIAGAFQNHANGASKHFPDGELDCDTFPAAYGALPLRWLDLGGWASVQKPNIMTPAGYDDIMTVTRAQCVGDNCCIEGAFCSYACGEGLLKFQWPKLQGRTGQSIGGLQCRNGKLHLTNPAHRTLCSAGTSKIGVFVKNKMSRNVAICRTNYPGDEKMSIPLDVQPGSTNRLAVPDQRTYWTWGLKPTSAQYYINLPGYAVEKACVWGNNGDDFGNFAPGVLGVSVAGDGRAYISAMPNHPTQMNVHLPYTITIEGGDIPCRYKNGNFCRGWNFDICETNGCTVSSSGGDLTYVLTDD